MTSGHLFGSEWTIRRRPRRKLRPGPLGFAVLLAAAEVATPLHAQPGSPAPAEIPALAKRADSLLARGRLADAQALFERLTRANPADERAWLGLADAETGLHRPDRAIAALRQALTLGVRSWADRAYLLAGLYAGIGQADSAVAWLRRSLDHRFERRPDIGSDSTFARLTTDARFRALAQMPPGTEASRDAGWRADLAVLVAEAKRLATGLDPVALTPAFDSAAAAVRERIGRLTNEQVYVELQRLLASLGNGHSVLYPLSTPIVTLTMLPVDLYVFSDGWYVVGGVGEGAALVGSRVNRIGRFTPSEALERVAPVVTRDNPMGLRWTGPYFLAYPAIAFAVGVADRPDSIRIELTDPSGKSRSVALAGGEFRPPAKLRAPTTSSSPAPLYLRHPDKPYWLARIPAASAVYVQFNQVVSQADLPLASFADSMSRAARAGGATNLIIDVRRNNGGSNTLNWLLHRALIKFEAARPGHQIYVITGRNTFSAAQNFINVVERTTSAIFAGEPSSSRPNSVGEDTRIRLPYSGIIGSVASRYFQDSDPLDDRQWIAPQIPVELSSRDYFGNRDPVLDAVLDAIKRRQRPR